MCVGRGVCVCLRAVEHWLRKSPPPPFSQVLIDENGIDMEADQVRMVKDMINGVRPGDGPSSRGFLYEIVANKRNNIDVDKVLCDV